LAPTVGIAVTGFCYPGEILQLFHRQDQQILRLSTAAARSHCLAGSAPFMVIRTNPADPSSPASFVIDKSDPVASGRSIFFG
jgi:hypothetical protein